MATSGFYRDETVQDLDKLLSMAKGPHSRFEPTWHLNLAFFFGEQWLFWNRGRLDRPRLDPSRITLTDNRIVGFVRTELAKMTKQKPSWQVVPISGEDADLNASLMGEKILDYLWRHLDMRQRLEDVILWSRITGTGFLKIYWDSARGKKVQILANPEGEPALHPETGVPLKPQDVEVEGKLPEGFSPKTIATGEVHVEVVSPFEAFVDPIATELKDAEWFIQQSVKSPEYVKARFGVDIEPDTDIAPGPTESRLFPSYQVAGTSGYKGIKLMEYWCQPNSRHPEGRRAVWARGKFLFQGPNPYGCLPYVMFQSIKVPGRFWASSVTEQLRGPQTEHNKMRSQIVENMQKMGNPALMKARQSNTNYSGIPGEVIDYDDFVPNAKPEYLAPPVIPAWVVQQQESGENAMQEISGQHEVSKAQVPAGVKAASAINLLQEADDTRLGPAIYAMEETLGIAGSMLLKLCAKYWTDERTIMIAGEDHKFDAIAFRGASLRENTQVEVQSGSMFPKSKAAKQAAIESILNLRMQYTQEPLDPKLAQKVFRDYEMGGLERLFGDIAPDAGQVNRENQRILQGEELPIHPYDKHEIHIDGHTEAQKQASYEALIEANPMIGQSMERHIALHRMQLMAVQQQMMQSQIMQPPNGQPGQQPQQAPQQQGAQQR